MSSEIGKDIRVNIFGESHGTAIGAVIDGLPPGYPIDMEEVYAFMLRRAPGRASYATARREADMPRVLSGLSDGKTSGFPLAIEIANSDQHSNDYKTLSACPRPGHADYTSRVRYGGHADMRGGGHFSGRLTAPLCFAGAVCMQILKKHGISVGAHIAKIGTIWDTAFDPVRIAEEGFCSVGRIFPVISPEAGESMHAEIACAAKACDSIGGVIECAAIGLPAGLGDPMFDGVENRLARALFGIPAVRGVEFGAGFAAAEMRGSVHNDPFYFDGDTVKTRTNHHGGILGGITSGMPIIFRVAIKPTPSIAKEQETVNLETGESETLVVHGRHDPSIVPRAVPCVEAVAAITILDILKGAGKCN